MKGVAGRIFQGKRFALKTALLSFLLLPVIVFLLPGQALAHRMLIENVEEGQLLVRYDDGTAAARAEITLYDEDNNILAQGKTDSQGYYSYETEKPLYRAVASDGMGHRARWVEGEESFWMLVPLWMRVLLGLSLVFFAAAVTYYRSCAKKAA